MQTYACALISGLVLVISTAAPCHALSSANIPLDSPIYAYLDKLAGFGGIEKVANLNLDEGSDQQNGW